MHQLHPNHNPVLPVLPVVVSSLMMVGDFLNTSIFVVGGSVVDPMSTLSGHFDLFFDLNLSFSDFVLHSVSFRRVQCLTNSSLSPHFLHGRHDSVLL